MRQLTNNAKLYIKENGLEHLVEAKLKAFYDDKNLPRPKYEGDIPEGNDGLGLMLLGLTGDQILETLPLIKT